jgi:hypothetical protein
MIVKEDLIEFLEDLNQIVHEDCETAWKINKAGMRRKIMGEMGEKITQKIIDYCVTYCGISNTLLYIGSKEKIRCQIDKNSYVDAQTDRHLKIKDKLVLICEAKTYVDASMVARARADFGDIKKYNENGKSILSCIISLQDSVKKESLNFHMAQGTIDYVFFLMDSKRQSSKPIFRPEFRKKISLDRLYECINKLIEKLGQ